jgi:hypothetical protein
MLVGIFGLVNPEQKLFELMYDPKYCIKMIKESDPYLGYVAFAKYSHIVNLPNEFDKILSELQAKYPNRLEAFLLNWDIFIQLKCFKKALSIAEIMYRKFSSTKFEDTMY